MVTSWTELEQETNDSAISHFPLNCSIFSLLRSTAAVVGHLGWVGDTEGESVGEKGLNRGERCASGGGETQVTLLHI